MKIVIESGYEFRAKEKRHYCVEGAVDIEQCQQLSIRVDKLTAAWRDVGSLRNFDERRYR